MWEWTSDACSSVGSRAWLHSFVEMLKVLFIFIGKVYNISTNTCPLICHMNLYKISQPHSRHWTYATMDVDRSPHSSVRDIFHATLYLPFSWFCFSLNEGGWITSGLHCSCWCPPFQSGSIGFFSYHWLLHCLMEALCYFRELTDKGREPWVLSSSKCSLGSYTWGGSVEVVCPNK